MSTQQGQSGDRGDPRSETEPHTTDETLELETIERRVLILCERMDQLEQSFIAMYSDQIHREEKSDEDN